MSMESIFQHKLIQCIKKSSNDVQFLILTGSTYLATKSSQNQKAQFFKELENKKRDIDLLVISSKFVPIQLFTKKSLPPPEILEEFMKAEIGIISTKVIDDYLFSIHFIHPAYLKYICSLRRAQIPYYRCFPLRNPVSQHFSFGKLKREYSFASKEGKTEGLLHFEHSPLVNGNFYLNDFQSMFLLGKGLVHAQKYKKARYQLLQKIVMRGKKENKSSPRDISKIFRYNIFNWPLHLKNEVLRDIKKCLK